MANPTTNFGWVMPTSTSLVTNLPADFNTFGQGVDTSMAQLKGGTTGQILSKTSATDMAFTWITPNPGDITGVTAGTGISGGGTSGDVTITNSMATAMTTKGDLVPATGSGTFSRLAVGTNGQTLVADSTTATGLKWATASSGSTFAGCRIYQSAATTSIANSTWTTVSFDSEVYDTDGFHSTSVNNSRITIPSGKAGYYLIIATTDFAQNSTAARGNIIMVNGTEKAIVSATPNTSEGATFNNSVILALSVGDYVETQVRQTSGGALNLRGTAIDATNLIAAYLGA